MGVRPVGAAHLETVDRAIPRLILVDVLLAVWWSCVTQAAV
jgi:hypothetical protein